MNDYGAKVVDFELARLERAIKRLYKNSAEGLEKTIDEYFRKLIARDKAKQKLLEAGKISREEYTQWRLDQIGRGRGFEVLRDKIAERLTDTHAVALEYVNNAVPRVYALNRNYAAYTIESAIGADMPIDFALWDEATVRRVLKANPALMPYYPKELAVERGIDLVYGQRQITANVTSGILQGKSIPQIAKSLQYDIPDMLRVSAIRAARTAMTSAQNGGRLDTYTEADKMGIPMKKEWMSTLDGRTRHSHRILDGERVGIHEKFSNGLMFPADPEGAAAEVYNCRCTMVSVIDGFDGKYRKTYREWEALKKK